MTDAGLENLGGLTAMQDLQLTYTSVTDAGLVNFKGLIGLKKARSGWYARDRRRTGPTQIPYDPLQNLYLGWTKVTDTGVENLQKALPNCDINH